MSPERWQHVRQVFEEASEMPLAERAGHLDRVCAEDRELRHEVDALLAAEKAAAGLWRAAGWARLDKKELDHTPEYQELGAYRLDEKIGEGGMSVVYRASRADDEYRHQVAIKVQRRGLDSQHLEQRFRSERQILARLAHPYIARLLDGGTTVDGRPYVVMEYVEGIPITDYCDRHRLTIDARLELFRQVCAAVQFAHQNLIVHRDLKPSNILVTAEGSPRLLDFGIAKLLGPMRDTEGPETTVAWLRLMTPSYASPEQARGGVITTASDVYSLGVLLYRLLSGRPPYRLKGRSAAEVERVLQELEPPLISDTPSAEPTGTDDDGQPGPRPEEVSAARGLRPEGLRRRLRGDLDTIVAKAMHKQADRRYASAEGLAEDLRRHLAGLPVTARRDSFAYRGRKFLRRHWLESTAVSMIVGLVVAFAFTTRMQSQAVARERDQVRAERDKNAEVLNFLTDIFETSSPENSRGETITAREILDRGAERIDEQLQERPDIRAALLLTMGNVNYNLGRYEVAEAQHRRSVETRRQLPAGEPLALAESIFFLGRTLLETSEPEAARIALRESLELARQIGDDGHFYRVESLQGLAVVARMFGEFEASVALFREALAIEEGVSGGESLGYAEALVGLARTQVLRGEYDDAQALCERAIAIERRLRAADDPRLALSLQRLSEVLFYQDDLDGAEAIGNEALALSEKLLGPNHPDVGFSLDNLAQIAIARQDYARAEGLFRRALAIGRAAFGEDDPRLAVALNNLGNGLWKAGDLAGAEAASREALAIYRRIWGVEHPDLASSVFNVGVLLEERGKVDEAAASYREALDIQRRTNAPEHTLAFPLIRLGNLLRAGGSPAEAEPLLREALAVRRSGLPDGHRHTAVAAGYLGIALLELKEYDQAEPLLLEAHSVSEQHVARHPARAEIWRQGLVELYRVTGRLDEAARYAAASSSAAPPLGAPG